MQTATMTPIKKEKVQIGRDTIDSLFNLTHAASTEETRLHLQHVYIKDGIALATDGHIAAWYKSDEIKGLTCALPINALKAFKKSMWVDISDNSISDGEQSFHLNKDYVSRQDRQDALFNLIPKKGYEEKVTLPAGSKVDETVDKAIGLNPMLLMKLGKALGVKKGQGVKLVMKDTLSPIQVHYEGEMRGLIMPMRI